MRRRVFIVVVLVASFAGSRSNEAAGDGSFAWSAPVNLGPIVNSPALEQAPVMSEDGRNLYFASTRPGGAGASDIWVSRRRSPHAPWGAPVNLGPRINSAANEGAPHLTPDGRFLFFVSNRDGSMDIWLSKRRHEHDDFGWETPFKLEPPVNLDTAFDAGPWLFGRELYFSSDRLNPGIPALDIFVALIRGSGTTTPPRPVAP